MSYLVLARKWRPQNFDDLVGQEAVAVSLKNALSKGTVSHAYLFSGPRGVGKTSTARILASSLNCTETTNFQPCGQCHNCRSIANSSSVDVLEIDGASNNSVDNIRELRETVKYAPSSCSYKFYIIDEIHMLTDQAFNALLKTLEEPPPHVIFVFATTSPKKIPSTIVSRCQHFIFKKVKKNIIKDHIEKIARYENIPISSSALEMIARSADGCMRDSLTILDQVSSFSDEITEREIHMLFGLPEEEVLESLAEAIIRGDTSLCLVHIRDLAEKGYDFRILSRELVEYFRNIAIIKVVDRPEKIMEFTSDERQGFERLASMVTIEELTLFLDELFKIESHVKNATFPRYVFELGLVKTSFIKGMAPVGDILRALSSSPKDGSGHNSPLKRLASLQQSTPLKTGTTQESHEKTSATISQRSQTDGTADTVMPGLWKQVIITLEKSHEWLGWLLPLITPPSFTSSEVTFILKGGMSVHEDSLRKCAPVIEKAVADVTGKARKVRIDTLEEKPPQKERLKKDILSNPIVEHAIKEFDGKMINIKPLH
jgi:DNA polymerase-3 subunit gamma/tau